MRAVTVIFALLLVSCSGGNQDACITSNDCFSGEVCRTDGFCGAPIVEVGPDGSANSIAADAANSSSADVAISLDGSPNNTTGSDMGSTSEMGRPVGDMPATGGCIVDPFDVCDDPEDPNNNSFPGAQFVSMTRGCQPSGFVPLDETISGRQCALDPEDQFFITVVECDADEPGMVIEATLDVKDDCNPDLIWFDVESIGTSCAAPNPDSEKTLRCETLADGRRRISIIWPGSNVPSVGSIRFSIQTPDRQDIAFDYDLNIVIREP